MKGVAYLGDSEITVCNFPLSVPRPVVVEMKVAHYAACASVCSSNRLLNLAIG